VKRSRELTPLSRDHHEALYAALVLRRANDATGTLAVEEFLEFWGEHGRRHFEIEESILLPEFAFGGGDPHHEHRSATNFATASRNARCSFGVSEPQSRKKDARASWVGIR
jgi:hypothetical protein